MLRRILDAYDGKLPDNSRVVFCNTGKERPETLEFVERCSLEWDVEIVWLEYRYHKFDQPDLRTRRNGNKYEARGEHRYEIVNYATASRDGRPLMDAIIARQLLPNPVARFCTVECKIRTQQRYLQSLGWAAWTACIGMRADEPARVERLRTTNRHGGESASCPLDEAGLELADVQKFWRESPFDLSLQQHEGNCDLCFLKGKGKLLRILKDRPDLANWWIEAEAEALTSRPGVARFRNDRPSYKALLAESQQPGLFDVVEGDELSEACHCTD